MTSEVPGRSWRARYPDLAGKVAVVAGTSSYLAGIAAALSGNGVSVATVAPERYDVAAFAVAADPGEGATWARVMPHVEQRLGPIDIAIVVAPSGIRKVVMAALLPDMATRGRGVIVEIGADVAPLTRGPGVRHRAVSGGETASAADIATAALWCASDTLLAPGVSIHIG